MIKYAISLLTICLLPALAQAQLDGALRVKGGKNITNNLDGKVMLELYGRGATQMMISNNGSFIGGRWLPFEPSVNWRLTPEDGIKNIYAKFKDANSEVSEVYELTIELDRTPPTDCSVLINDGMKSGNPKDRMVRVSLEATEAVTMQLSNRNDFAGAIWQPFGALKRWQLQGLDGLKTVFARFMDAAGNVSETVSADFYLDSQPPINPKVVINQNDEFTNKREVKLSLSAEGATEMFVRGGNEWVAYQKELPWTLEEGDGEKIVAVRFRDEVNNASVVVTDVIRLDTEPPQMPRIAVNGGNKYTKETSLALRLSAVGDVYEMRVSNDSTFKGATWRLFNNSLAGWGIADSDGMKYIYAEFRDRAGNLSDIAMTSILLDRTPPTKPFVEIVGDKSKITNDTSATVDLRISAEGAEYMMVSNASTFYGAKWEVYKPSYKGWKLGGAGEDGEKGVFVKFRDKAGNVSDMAGIRIKLDRTGPVDCHVSIDRNREFTIQPDKMVELDIRARGATKMRIANSTSELAKAPWEPFAPTKKWQLNGDDGLKSVAAQFSDDAPNLSDVVMDNIILDRKPPFECSIEVDKGEETTSDPDKVVTLQVRAKNAVKMMIGNSEDFAGERWRGYTDANISWALVGNDGKKTVYVKFQDEAGNESAVYSDDINMDRTPPKKGTVKILTENNISKIQKVELELFAQDAVEMMLCNYYDFREAKWEPYTTKKEWMLAGGEDGMKFVFVKFRDKVKNISAVSHDKIGLDTNAPKGGDIKIENGAKFTTNIGKLVSLRLNVQGGEYMMISNNKDFSNASWQKFEPYLFKWRLDGEDGEKQVYAKFKDKANNETQPVVANITLDRQQPYDVGLVINNNDGCTNAANNRVSLAIKATGATEMMLSNTSHFSGAVWEPFKLAKDWALSPRDGEKTVFVKFRDEAGNETRPDNAKIVLDTDAPVPGMLKINGDNTLTKEATVSLTFNARNATFMVVSNSAKFEDGVWEPYQASKRWALKEGAGMKRVYVKFKDTCNNESAAIYKEITLSYDQFGQSGPSEPKR
jgi:hypothetical protein